MGRHTFALSALALLGLSAVQAATPASAAEEFFKNKTVTILVGQAAGGGTDLESRVLAKYYGKYLPGKPSVIVQNMTGAGGLTATLHLYSVSPKDGTVVSIVQRATATVTVFDREKSPFEATKFQWLGARAGEVLLGGVYHTSPTKTIQDAMKRETIVGSTGGNAEAHMMPFILNATIGTKFKVVSGYPGGSDITLAIERGEVEGRMGWSYSSLIGTNADWLRDKKFNVLTQVSLAKHKTLPDVPLAIDLALDASKRQTLNIFAARQELGYPLVAPPGTPAERVTELRRAFDATMKDPEYLAETSKLGWDVEPHTGEQIQEIVQKIDQTPRDVIDSTRAMLKASGIDLM